MTDFTAFLTAPAEDRRGAFLATAARLDTGEVNVEKDFWVCWTLDALFSGRPRVVLGDFYGGHFRDPDGAKFCVFKMG